jgi:hypothetical protein
MTSPLNPIVFIELDCVGTTTGEKYQGVFELKKFLSHKDITESSRVANRLSTGLRRPPSYSIPALLGGIQDALKNIHDEVAVEVENKDKIALVASDEAVRRIIEGILPELKDTDPQADFIQMLAVLNAHIVKAPDWWKPKNEELGGYHLLDYTPIIELNRQLGDVQRPADKEEKAE